MSLYHIDKLKLIFPTGSNILTPINIYSAAIAPVIINTMNIMKKYLNYLKMKKFHLLMEIKIAYHLF